MGMHALKLHIRISISNNQNNMFLSVIFFAPEDSPKIVILLGSPPNAYNDTGDPLICGL